MNTICNECDNDIAVVSHKSWCSSYKPSPYEIGRMAKDNGHVPTFLTALCELLMCADPSPLSPLRDAEIKHGADMMARKLGFSNWVEAYHGLVN